MEILEIIRLWRKISSSLLNNIICKMFTNHMYNYLTMCKQIADVGLSYWCWVSAVLRAICSCAGRWSLASLEYYEMHTISSQIFFVWVLLLIVLTWNSSPLRSNILRLQCTCCTVSTNSRRPHGSLLVWACQCPLSQPLSSPQLFHNDSLWA